METSAGEDKTLRRWRLTLTIGAWLLIAQSALAIITGLAGIALAPMVDPTAMLGQYGSLIDRSSLAMFSTLMGQTALLNRVQTVGSIVLLAGSIGLLLRKKWGWYTVLAVHSAAVVAVFIWVMPMFKTLYLSLDPAHAGSTSLLLSIVTALAPAVVVAFLLAKPILSQFERSPVEDNPTEQS